MEFLVKIKVCLFYTVIFISFIQGKFGMFINLKKETLEIKFSIDPICIGYSINGDNILHNCSNIRPNARGNVFKCIVKDTSLNVSSISWFD